MEDNSVGWQEWLLWFPPVRHFLGFDFWKRFRNARCRVLQVELCTIAGRDQILIVTSEVIEGYCKGKQWKMMSRYDPSYDSAGRKAALQVKKLIDEFTKQRDFSVYTANFYYWVDFLDNYLAPEHLDLSRLADPSKSNFRFVVSW